MTKPSQAKGLLHKVPDWLGRLNSNKRSLCLRLAALLPDGADCLDWGGGEMTISNKA